MISLTNRKKEKHEPSTGIARRALLPASGGKRGFIYAAIKEVRTNGSLFLLALPAIAVVFTVCYMPMPGIILAFKNFTAPGGIWGSPWTGLDNFKFLVNAGIAYQIIRNTLLLNVLFLIAAQVCSITMAAMLYEIYQRFVAKVFQSFLFFPHFVSWVIVGYFTFAFLNDDSGYVNYALTQVKLAPVNWFSQPTLWIPILVFLSVWKGLGYFSVIYLAGMLSINPEYQEAARMDGANKLQEFWYVNLPMIRPLIIINVLLAIGRVFYANFDFIWNVTRDTSTLLETVNVIDTFIYRSLVSVGTFNLAAAAGFFQAIMGFILVLLANWGVRRFDKEQALF